MMYMILLVHSIFVFIIVTDFLKTNKGGVFNPFIWVVFFHLLVFWLKPLAGEFFDFKFPYLYMEIYPSLEDKVRALLVADLWFLAMYIGLRHTFHYKPNFENFNITSVDKKAAKITFLIVAPLALYSTLSTFSGVEIDGREGSVIMERIDGVAINVNSNGYMNDAKHLFVGLLVLAFGVWRFNYKTISFLAIFILIRAYQGWGRWAIVFSLISAGLMYLYCNKKMNLPKGILLPAALVFMLFNMLGQNREVVKELIMNGEVTNVVEEAPSFGEGLDNLDFANYEYLVYITSTVPEMTGTYSYGTQYLQVFTEPVPRSLWKDKPIGQPIKMFDLNDYGNFVGLTHSMPGDAWISLGWVGVFFISLIFSLMISKFYIFFCVDGRAYIVLLYIAASPLLSQWFRDGGVVSILKFFLFSLLPIILWKFVKSRMSNNRFI
jgi:oligosaccharide repeat unit polymerase